MNAGEIYRLLANMIMVGVVDQLDEQNERIRVSADGMLTDWIPWGEQRAGPLKRTWTPPGEGEQVVVLSPYGDPAQAVVLCSINQDKFPAPANSKTTDRTVYSDGTVVEYDTSTTTMTVNVGMGKVIVNCNTAEVHAAESVLLDTPKTKTTGDLEVGGGITAKKDIEAKGDVKAGDISVIKHHHTAQGSTAPTTAAQA